MAKSLSSIIKKFTKMSKHLEKTIEDLRENKRFHDSCARTHYLRSVECQQDIDHASRIKGKIVDLIS